MGNPYCYAGILLRFHPVFCTSPIGLQGPDIFAEVDIFFFFFFKLMYLIPGPHCMDTAPTYKY